MKNNADENLHKCLSKISEIINPLFKNNGNVNLSTFEPKGDLEHLLALALNCKFDSSEEQNNRSFSADDVIALQLEIENNKFLKYWGKINWLSKPNNHECHKMNQDPFYGLFKLENKQVEIVEIMFGDYDKKDLDGQIWIESKINWMYDL